MHVAAEEEELPAAVVPAVVGAEHFIVLPHVGGKAEVGGGKVAAVLQAGGFHKGGVQVHVHLVVEHEQVGFGVIGAVQALDDLSVFVPHGAAVLEDGHGVLCVVVQVARTEGIVVFVFQLHQGTPESGHVVVHYVLQGFAAQLRLVLDNAHMAHGVDDVGVDVPQGGIAQQVGVVVQEAGRPDDLAVALPVFVLNELGALGADQVHFPVVPLLFLGLLRIQEGRCRQGRQQEADGMNKPAAHYLRAFHTSRVNSHSWKSGSMMIYVSFTFPARKASTASFCLISFTLSRIWV